MTNLAPTMALSKLSTSESFSHQGVAGLVPITHPLDGIQAVCPHAHLVLICPPTRPVPKHISYMNTFQGFIQCAPFNLSLNVLKLFCVNLLKIPDLENLCVLQILFTRSSSQNIVCCHIWVGR